MEIIDMIVTGDEPQISPPQKNEPEAVVEKTSLYAPAISLEEACGHYAKRVNKKGPWAIFHIDDPRPLIDGYSSAEAAIVGAAEYNALTVREFVLEQLETTTSALLKERIETLGWWQKTKYEEFIRDIKEEMKVALGDDSPLAKDLSDCTSKQCELGITN